MIYKGTDRKFRVDVLFTQYNHKTDPFTITVRDAFGREAFSVNKESCLRDTEGNCYFTFENPKTGDYFAYFRTDVPDDDYEKGTRTFTDKQRLCKVNLCGCNLHTCACEGEHGVRYEEIWSVDVGGNLYLADKDGNLILTSDGKRIQLMSQNEYNDNMAKVRLNMTGDGFKQLVEGLDPNSEVNTIPEVMRVMQGISDETTVKQEIKDESGTTYDEASEKLYLNGAKPKTEE